MNGADHVEALSTAATGTPVFAIVSDTLVAQTTLTGGVVPERRQLRALTSPPGALAVDTARGRMPIVDVFFDEAAAYDGLAARCALRVAAIERQIETLTRDQQAEHALAERSKKKATQLREQAA